MEDYEIVASSTKQATILKIQLTGITHPWPCCPKRERICGLLVSRIESIRKVASVSAIEYVYGYTNSLKIALTINIKREEHILTNRTVWNISCDLEQGTDKTHCFTYPFSLFNVRLLTSETFDQRLFMGFAVASGRMKEFNFTALRHASRIALRKSRRVMQVVSCWANQSMPGRSWFIWKQSFAARVGALILRCSLAAFRINEYCGKCR